MKVYLVNIYYPYEENATLLGVYATEEKAEKAIKIELSRFQRLTGRTDEQIKSISTYISEQEVM